MRYDVIYLSPHLDDVALSCGGQVYDLTADGRSVLIVTIAAGDPPATPLSDFAMGLHERWKLAAAATARRRAEDVAACQALGADYLHWDLPDCIYRQHPQTGAHLYTSNGALFGMVHEAETAVTYRLAAQMAALPAHGRIVAPLTVGNHVDHQLVRRAAEQCFGDRLLYYEEYPYVRLSGALDCVIPPQSQEWQAEVVSVSAAGMAARVAAIAAFESQVSSFFNGRSDLEAQIRQQIAKIGGERVWKRTLA